MGFEAFDYICKGQMSMFDVDKESTENTIPTDRQTDRQTDRPKKAHCLFEQSGTFKNEFIKLGIPAEDYDIQNEFGETDHVVDLFAEIRKAYDGEPSIFDSIKTDELIFAFFPCTRFEDQALLIFRGDQFQQKRKTDLQKLEKDLDMHEELHELYRMVTMLAYVCIDKDIPLIIENPYSSQHYLVKYWCLKPKVIDTDRTLKGDYFKKPTQYWFLGTEPKFNIVFESIQPVKLHTISNYEHDKNNNIGGFDRKISRSMIHPQYANRFIREYIL